MKEKTLTECLENHFSEASAIYANWRMFGTGKVELLPNDFLLTRLKACAFKHHPRNLVGKSIVRPERVNIDQIWYEHYMPLLQGGYFNGDGEEMNYDGTTYLDVPKHADKFLRINHYSHRDETFFFNSRLAKAKAGIYGELELLLEHYDAFSMIRDTYLIRFIQKNYPEMYEKFWTVSNP